MQNDKSKFKKEFIHRLVLYSIATIRFVEALRTNSIMWPIIDQLIRCSTSVGANVVEAQASSSKREYAHYFQIALKSANESKYWLYLIKQTNPAFKKDADKLLLEVQEIANILGASVITLKKTT